MKKLKKLNEKKILIVGRECGSLSIYNPKSFKKPVLDLFIAEYALKNKYMDLLKKPITNSKDPNLIYLLLMEIHAEERKFSKFLKNTRILFKFLNFLMGKYHLRRIFCYDLSEIDYYDDDYYDDDYDDDDYDEEDN